MARAMAMAMGSLSPTSAALGQVRPERNGWAVAHELGLVEGDGIALACGVLEGPWLWRSGYDATSYRRNANKHGAIDRTPFPVEAIPTNTGA